MIRFITRYLKLFFVLFTVTAVFLLNSCEKHNEFIIDKRQALMVEDSVKDMANKISRDISRNGPNAWLDYFDNSPDFFMASDGSLAFPDYDSAVVFVKQFAKGIKSIKLTWNNLEVEPYTMNLAGVRAGFYEIITDTLKHQIIADGYFTGTARHTYSGWKLLNLHWSMKK